MLLTVTNVTTSAGFFRVAESALMELEHLSASRDALSRKKKGGWGTSDLLQKLQRRQCEKDAAL